MKYFLEVKPILMLLILVFCHSYLFAGNETNIINRQLITQYTADERDSLFGVANDFLTKSKPDEALFVLFDLLKGVEKYSANGIEYQISIAEAYRERHEHEKGKYLLYNILELDDISPSNRAYACNRLAALYNEGCPDGISRSDTVLKYSEMCIEISKKNNFIEYLALSQNEIGFVYYREKKYEVALSYFLSAYDNFEKLGFVENIVNVSINMSLVYLDLGLEDKAMDILKDAMEKCKIIGNQNLLRRLNLYISGCYRHKNDMKNAYKYLFRGYKQQESFYRERIGIQINEIAAKYDLNLKEARIKKEQQKLKEQQQQKCFYMILLLLACVMIVVLVIIFRLKRKVEHQKRELARSENEKLRDRLEYKNKELTANAVLLAQISNFTSEISKQIKEVLPETNKKGQKIMTPIIEKLENGYQKDVWEEFELRFKNVNHEFYTKLRDIAPDLTPNELKICAFLRLNMSTKNIAALTQRSHRTVDSIRLSIRKKLKLVDTDINLVNYLMGI